MTADICVSCEDATATTDCGAVNHRCPLCADCRAVLDGTEWDDASEAPAEGARLTGPSEPGRQESAPAPHILPSAGQTPESTS